MQAEGAFHRLVREDDSAEWLRLQAMGDPGDERLVMACHVEKNCAAIAHNHHVARRARHCGAERGWHGTLVR